MAAVQPAPASMPSGSHRLERVESSAAPARSSNSQDSATAPILTTTRSARRAATNDTVDPAVSNDTAPQSKLVWFGLVRKRCIPQVRSIDDSIRYVICRWRIILSSYYQDHFITELGKIGATDYRRRPGCSCSYSHHDHQIGRSGRDE
jgi:hypothetical protein